MSPGLLSPRVQFFLANSVYYLLQCSRPLEQSVSEENFYIGCQIRETYETRVNHSSNFLTSLLKLTWFVRHKKLTRVFQSSQQKAKFSAECTVVLRSSAPSPGEKLNFMWKEPIFSTMKTGFIFQFSISFQKWKLISISNFNFVSKMKFDFFSIFNFVSKKKIDSIFVFSESWRMIPPKTLGSRAGRNAASGRV